MAWKDSIGNFERINKDYGRLGQQGAKKAIVMAAPFTAESRSLGTFGQIDAQGSISSHIKAPEIITPLSKRQIEDSGPGETGDRCGREGDGADGDGRRLRSLVTVGRKARRIDGKADGDQGCSGH